jgi:FHS family L-fucose permease-like MFS transporter
LAGRFIGSMILRVCSAHLTLAAFALINSIMMVLIILHLGWISVTALFLSCFFMSIMYPTIFALGIRGLGEHTKFGSSLIVMAIVGGAFMPFVMGWLADTYAMRIGFVMPLICFVYITFYAAFWPALERLDTGHEVAD